MATQVQRRRGTTTDHSTFTGAEGELTVDTTKDTVVVHDGTTAGGRPLAREDLNNVSSADVTAKVSAGTTSAAGKVQLTDSTSSTSTTTAATPNSVKLAKDAADAAQATANAALPATGGTISSDLTISGNLTVNGTTTNINTQNLVVEDKNVILGDVATPTDVTADGGGITLKGSTDKTISWVDATDAWTSSEYLDLPAGTAANPSLFLGGDVNTGLYSPGADQVAISTGGTGRLFVDASGNVIAGAASTTGSKLCVVTGISAVLDLYRTTTGEARLNFFNNNDSSTATQAARIAALLTTATAGAENGALLFSTTTSGASSEKLRITSAGLVGIGTVSPERNLHVFKGESGGATSNAESSLVLENSSNTYLQFLTPSSSESGFLFGDGDNDAGAITYNHSNNSLNFRVNASAAMTVDSSGRLLVGTSTSVQVPLSSSTLGDPGKQLASATQTGATSAQYAYSTTSTVAPNLVLARSRGALNAQGLVSDGDSLGRVVFEGSDGQTVGTNAGFIRAAVIEAQVDGTPGANDMPGRIILATTADGASSPTERMRITNNGEIWLGSGSGSSPGLGNTTTGTTFSGTRIYVSHPDNYSLLLNSNADSSVVSFRRSGTQVGTISVTSSATAYNTSSDYRLKENVTAVTDGITRLQQLKPSRFNFIADPDKTVDGFLAHEVQDIVPEAITGEKDAVDDEGNPQYQGIDQSKLVPLLTAALQEAVAKIETLEARLTAAGIE